jgi:hypothetical protein
MRREIAAEELSALRAGTLAAIDLIRVSQVAGQQVVGPSVRETMVPSLCGQMPLDAARQPAVSNPVDHRPTLGS